VKQAPQTDETQPSATSDSAGTQVRFLDVEQQKQIIIAPPTLKEVTRRDALEKELRFMQSIATAGIGQEGGSGITESARERMLRDSRFRYPRAQVRELLDRFCKVGDETEADFHTLVLVAHPDDESIGIGGQLKRLRNVTVVHVTDGAPRSVEYVRRFGFDHPDDYAAARREEVSEALRLAGIPEERYLCLGIPDGECQHRMVDLSYAIAELIERLAPDVIVTHPYEGGHTDHDAISFAVQLACGVLRREGLPQPAVFELTSYYNRAGRRVVAEFLPFGPRDDIRTLSLSPELQSLKRRMFQCFRTQQECISVFPTDRERFRPAPRYNYTKPPHPGTLDYERLTKRLSGKEWRKRAFEALNALRADA
jgi:LmbE family N-acetylglucosaminyl deacetylase